MSKQATISSSLPLGIAASVGTGIILACLWAGITIITGYQFSIAAIGVGFIVGFVMQIVSKQEALVPGVIAGIIALAACILGNIATALYWVASGGGVGILDVIAILDFDMVIEIMELGGFFSIVDMGFYLAAAGTAYVVAGPAKEEETTE